MIRFVQTAVLVTLVLACAGAYAALAWRDARRLTPEDENEIPVRLERIPLETKDPVFRGTRDYLEDRIVRLSGADHYYAVDYVADDGGAVRLHVGAASRTDAWFHAPAVCLPAHGWTTGLEELVPIWPDLEGAGAGDRVWRMELRKAGARMLVYYWYQYGDRIITSRGERRSIRFKNLLAGRKDRPAQVAIFYAPIDLDIAHSEARIESLVRALWPHLFTVLTRGD